MQRLLRTAAATALLVGLSACGSITASLATSRATAELADLMDLDRDQKRALHSDLETFIERARAETLPLAVELLMRTRALMYTGADARSLADIQLGWMELMDDGVRSLIPDTADLLVGLSPHQLDHFEAQLHDRLDEAFADLHLDPGERRQRAEQRLVEGFEDLTGELRPDQREALLAVARTIPDERPAIRDTFRARIGLLIDGVRRNPDRDAVEALLVELWEARDQVIGGTRNAEQRRADDLRLMLTLDQSLDPQQRASAVATIDKRIDRLQRFAGP